MRRIVPNAPTMSKQVAPLPTYRLVAYKPPFTFMDADMFGPILIKQGTSTAKTLGLYFHTYVYKRYSSRSCTSSLETDDFINVLRLFIVRHVKPGEI